MNLEWHAEWCSELEAVPHQTHLLHVNANLQIFEIKFSVLDDALRHASFTTPVVLTQYKDLAEHDSYSNVRGGVSNWGAREECGINQNFKRLLAGHLQDTIDLVALYASLDLE